MVSLEPKFFAGKIRPQMQHSNIYIYHLKNEKQKKQFLRNWEQLFTSLYKGSAAVYIC